MKAIRKEDGKEIEVQLYTDRQYIETEVDERERGRRIYLEGALIIKEAVDWDAFRREAAKDLLVGFASSGLGVRITDAAYAVSLADELIKQLKDGK